MGDRKRHMSGNREEDEGSDGDERRRRSSRDTRSETRKRSSGSSRADSDDNDYSSRKRQEESVLEKLSSCYEDGDLENKQDCGDKLGSKVHSRAGQSERRNISSNHKENDGSQSRSRGKEDRSHDGETEKLDKDYRFSEKKESSQEKGQGSTEKAKSSRRRWDEADTVRITQDGYFDKDDYRSGTASDPKHESSIEMNGYARKGLDYGQEKIVKSNNNEDRRADSERGKSKGRSEPQDTSHEDNILDRDRIVKPRHHRTPGSYDVAESWSRPLNTNEDGNMGIRDKTTREEGHTKRSRTPERSGRHHQDSENLGVDYERRSDFKRMEIEKDDYMDERSEGNGDTWNDENKDRDNSKECWERRKRSNIDKDSTNEYTVYDHTREWEVPRHGRERTDNERPHVRSVRSSGGRSSGGAGSQPQYGNQESRYFNKAGPQGMKGNRVGRGGRIRPTGRDNQQLGMPLPMMGSSYGPLGMPPPGPMQPLIHGMSPATGPPMSPGVFISPFTQPVWPGARGVDMNLLAVPPSPRFAPGNPPNPAMFNNQSGFGRGVLPGISSPGFNPTGPMMARGTPIDKTPGGWVPPRSSGTTRRGPSRGEQNDYSQNFVDTGMWPQNFIRELELTNVVEDYPKLRELIQKKDEIVAKSATSPMYYKCDLKEFELSPEFFGTKFDVILVDPPWEEYVHRAPGVADHMEYWSFEEIMNLKIEAIADTPSFIFLWVGDGIGLEQGRQCLKKWGFRRCEDICWAKTNKNNATPGLRHDSHTLFQHSKEHCLMGIKGTVRRGTDGHIIHANIDTDVIIAEEPPYGSTQKPEDMYRIIEHFSLGRRRLELFGEDHNIRAGWLTVGKELSSSNFNAEAYIKNFADKDGKVWQGGGGRNPPPELPHLVLTTPDIEALRPKSPMKNQQQMQQQQSASISLTTGIS